MQVYSLSPPQLPSGDTTPAPVGIEMAPLPDMLGDIVSELPAIMLPVITGEMLGLPQMPYSVWQPVSQYSGVEPLQFENGYVSKTFRETDWRDPTTSPPKNNTARLQARDYPDMSCQR